MALHTRKRLGWNCHESEVTDEKIYLKRRQLIKASGLSLLAPSIIHAKPSASVWSTNEPLTSEYTATHYNNFYEFSLSKDGPAKKAKDFKTDPWSVTIDGECEKPGTYHLEDILKQVEIEERIYRLRCVEGWSMVIPWMGFELGQLLKQFSPTSKAKYIEFETLLDPKRMPGQRKGALGFVTLPWPYREGLRMDEAMHPLTILATGLYGKALPGQNGAPLRLVVPWKYGFKSIKSIVRISFKERQPVNTWQQSAPNEYGFFANVNPNVDHPRWSQAKERRLLDESLFGTKRMKTQMFNGYEEYVAELYRGMDLTKHF